MYIMKEGLEMNKYEFMSTLKKSLGSMSQSEKNDILYDYEEHFRIGIENGKTEAVIVEELGDPIAIGASYNTSSFTDKVSRKPKNRSVLTCVFIAIGLGLFNLIFILGPYFGLVAGILGLFAGAVGFTFGGFAYFICIIAFPHIPFFMDITIIGNKVISLFISVGLTALGLLFFIGMYYVTKWFIKLTVKYVKLNIRIITNNGWGEKNV